MTKRPKTSIRPAPAKQPKAGQPADSLDDRPAWRLNRLEVLNAFGGWHGLDRRKLLEVRDKLANFESMTWSQILIDGKKQNHAVQIDQLSPEARRRLADLHLDDIDELVSLRLSGKERVFGIRDRHVLMLLWWDPNHVVCPAREKHT